MYEDKKYNFTIVARKSESGDVTWELAWDANQGLGKQCGTAMDALLSGKAIEEGVWQDPPQKSTVKVQDVEDEDTQIKTQAPQTVQNRI